MSVQYTYKCRVAPTLLGVALLCGSKRTRKDRLHPRLSPEIIVQRCDLHVLIYPTARGTLGSYRVLCAQRYNVEAKNLPWARFETLSFFVRDVCLWKPVSRNPVYCLISWISRILLRLNFFTWFKLAIWACSIALFRHQCSSPENFSCLRVCFWLGDKVGKLRLCSWRW